MPGMMNTILDLGLNDDAVARPRQATGHERFAYDAYRRLIKMYGDVVSGVEQRALSTRSTRSRLSAGVHNDAEIDADGA